MANKTKSKSATSQSNNYKTNNRQAKNRKFKLEKQLKLQPNNKQIEMALKDIHYRRKTPKKREWSASWIRVAKIFKLFEGRFDRDIMSANPAISTAALQNRKENMQPSKTRSMSDKNFFSIAARVGAI